MIDRTEPHQQATYSPMVSITLMISSFDFLLRLHKGIGFKAILKSKHLKPFMRIEHKISVESN